MSVVVVAVCTGDASCRGKEHEVVVVAVGFGRDEIAGDPAGPLVGSLTGWVLTVRAEFHDV